MFGSESHFVGGCGLFGTLVTRYNGKKMKSEIILLTIAMFLFNIDSCFCAGKMILLIMIDKLIVQYAGVILSDADCNVHMRATSVTPSVFSLHWVAHQLSSFCKTFYKMKVDVAIFIRIHLHYYNKGHLSRYELMQEIGFQ